MKKLLKKIQGRIDVVIFSVPIQVKVVGIGLVPILILGVSLNYWITTGLSDWLSYILSDVRVQAAMEAGARSVLLVTVLGSVFSIFISFFLTFVLTRPILALRKMAQRVADGDLGARADVRAKDEIGELAIAINTMTDHLISTQEDMARINYILDAINKVALAAEQEMDIHDSLYKVLENLLLSMGLKTGWVYLRDPERQVFHLASWFGVPDEIQQYILHEPSAPLCSCQSDLITESLQINERKCDRLSECKSATLIPPHITIPLVARDQEFGVINLLREKNVTIRPVDIELLSSVGTQVAEIVSNAWLRLKLAEKEIARQVLLESLVQAQEEERARLARELHDGAGQMLTSLLVRLKILEKKVVSSLPEFRNDLENMQENVSQTIEQVRELSYRLRPPDLDEFGLSMALEALVQDMSNDMDFKTNCTCGLASGDLSKELEVVLYRIAQEGLTNILRHANAKHVKLDLGMRDNGVFMVIDDDGDGFDPKKISVNKKERHLGLISMRERAEIMGGELDIFTTLGEGTSLQVFIPLPEDLS